MDKLFEFVSPPSPCSYLPEQTASLEYAIFGELSAADYFAMMAAGWRRFGHTTFRPNCAGCQSCQPLRVPVATFRPNRSQKRAVKANADVELVIGRPSVTPEKLDLYDRFHSYQADHVGWPDRGGKDAGDYISSYVQNPFATEEWCYYLAGELIGVGYVDALPGGLSAMYFFHDPDRRDRSLGTFNVLRILAEAARRNLPHVYLGYFVAGYRSLEYKANFVPNEVYDWQGCWVPFRA